MEVVLLLAADHANVAQTGKLNVMGIFNDINAPTFPVRHPAMHLVVKLAAELGEFSQQRRVTVKLLDEDGVEMVNLGQDINLPIRAGARRPEFNFIMELRDLVFPRPGVYEFAVYVDKDFKRSLPIYVHEARPPEQGAESE